MGYLYVTTSCESKGCQIIAAQQALNTAQAIYREAQRLESENHALWCDPGGHAFSPRTKGYETWTRKISDPDTGIPVEMTMLVCPEHLKDSSPIRGAIQELRCSVYSVRACIVRAAGKAFRSRS